MKGGGITMQLEKNIHHKGWNIKVEVTEEGFTIYAHRKEGNPIPSMDVEPGGLAKSIETMKAVIDTRNELLEQNAKELNDVVPEVVDEEVPF